MSTAMDVYLSATDSLSLQDMLDIDIKSEIDVLVGDHNDLSDFNFSEIPPLEDSQDIKWLTNNSNHSNSSFTLDFSSEDGSKMVNPNAVMPILSLAQNIRSPSPSLKESHLNFSPSTIKLSSAKHEVAAVKKDLISKLDDSEEKKSLIQTIAKINPIQAKPLLKTGVKATTIATATPTLLTFRNAIQRQLSSPITVTQINNIGIVRTITTSNNHANRKQQFVNSQLYEEDGRTYPKPAYSYSCLIAMALKNSKTGSLPVSEIYNFMCKHFPYFKTAPNGWKNSVRHNLSLNKCFEKIEKPALNGAQRKGCLWAMNPAKISKMDEEVQKWSRKDPSAIRKAMINPENLESLERGELKFTCSYDEGDNFGDSCGSAESEEGSESEPEPENNFDTETEYIEFTTIKTEADEASDFDIEVTDTIYDEMDIEDDKEILRVEMALAQKELFHYDKSVSGNKRRRTYIIQN